MTPATPAVAPWARVHRDDLVRLRRARDRMDRDYAEPLDVPGPGGRGAHVGRPLPPQLPRGLRRDPLPAPHDPSGRAGRSRCCAGATCTVTEVCMEVGCTSLGSFSARFTELMGETPSDYRARSHEERARHPGLRRQAGRPARRERRVGQDRRSARRWPVPNLEGMDTRTTTTDRRDAGRRRFAGHRHRSPSPTASSSSTTTRRRSPSTATSSGSP